MACERWFGGGVFVTAMLAAVGAGAQAPQAPDGAELYKRACAQCHETGVGRAPSRSWCPHLGQTFRFFSRSVL